MMSALRSTAFVIVLTLVAAACGADSSATATPANDVDAVAAPNSVDAEPADGLQVEDTTDVADTATTSEPIVAEPVDEPSADESAVTALRSGEATGEPTFAEDFPDIIAVQATQDESGSWRFDVTVSSPYDTPQRYADAWRVVDPEGNELGIRVLTHDHANEQPFTRSQSGIAIADDVSQVTVQGRDLANGWGGAELVVALS